MASLARREKERCSSTGRRTQWSTEVPAHCKSIGLFSETAGYYTVTDSCRSVERPSPEGAGSSGGDSHGRSDVPSAKPFQGQRARSEDHLNYDRSGTGTYGPAMSENVYVQRTDRKVACCEKCSTTLVALKKQALSLAVHQHSSKDSDAVSAFLHDNLRVHTSRSVVESRDREGDHGVCGACGTHLNQLKQEAIHLALTREHVKWAVPPPSSRPPAGSVLTSAASDRTETRCGERAVRETPADVPSFTNPQPHGRTQSPHSPQISRSPRMPQSPRTPHSPRTPQSPRRRPPKSPNPDMDRWVEEQQRLVASASKSTSMTGGNGVTIYPYHQTEEVSDEAGPIKTSPKMAHISRVATMANSAAMSFLARAAQKLNLSARKKALGFGSSSAGPPGQLSTCFRAIIQKNPPPVPPCLLQAAARTRDSPNPARDKVKVVLRVCPSPSADPTQPPILRVDSSKRRVIVVDPVFNSQLRSLQTQTLGGEGKALLKTYSFDAAYPRDSSQAEVCAGVLGDVIRCAVSGSDGCVLGLGCADAGPCSSMVGSDDSAQNLGLIPCAISWLYSAIERRKEKTWTEQTVSVSAVELCCGEQEILRDLLANEVAPSSGNIQDNPAAPLDLREDPINGIQLRNLRVVKAPTAERAASLLDAAIASRRRGSQTGGRAGDIMPPSPHSSHVFFSLHVQHPRTDSSSTGKGPSRLTLIDLCNSMKVVGVKSDDRTKLPLADEGPIILAILSGHKNIPNKGSKLALLLRQAMSGVNCHTTVVAQVSHLPTHLIETLSTVQMASRIRRAQSRVKQSTSCSPCGRSLSRERSGGPHSLSLRAFHSSGEVGVDPPRLRLRGDLDDRSSSDQSCDTVIHINSDGPFRPNGDPTKLTQHPEFVHIIPSLPPGKVETDDADEFASLIQELLSIPRPREEERKKDETAQKVETGQTGRDCLKCDTFAELQERLGCIDGSETDGTDVPKPPSKEPSSNPVVTESQPRNDTGKRTDAESLEAPQQTPMLLKREFSCSQISVGEQQTDGVFPGDSFQREDSGLYDCEEGSAASSSEDPPNQAFNQAKTSDLPNVEPPMIRNVLHSQNCHADTQIGAIPGSLPLSSQSDMRTSPAGKSSPLSPALFSPASSSSSPPSLATSIILGEILPRIPTEELKEMKATITVTVQQPLDMSGQDEIVFTMVEEVTISGALERGGKGGKVIHIRDINQSPAHAQGCAGSRPIRIISNVSEDSGATGCAYTGVDTTVRAIATETQKSLSQFRGEKRLLPSFINPMLIDDNRDCDLEGAKPRGNSDENFTRVEILSECRQNILKHLEDEKAFEKERRDFAIERDNAKKSDSISRQVCYDTPLFEETAFQDDMTEDKACERRNNTGSSRPRAREPVYPSSTIKGSLGGEISRKITGNPPGNPAASPGCPATMSTALRTASLPRGWHNASHQESCWGGHMTDSNHRDPRGVTSSTPCSPGVTPERRQGRQYSPANHGTSSSWARENLPFSPPRKYSMETRQGASSPQRKDSGSLVETSSLSMKHDSLSGRLRSPIEESSRLFSAKLEQLASRTYSQGKTPMEIQTPDRGGSTTSVSSKGSSKGSSQGSYEGNSKGNYEGSSNGYYDSKGNSKGCYEGDSTLPRVSRSPRRTPRSISITDHRHHSTSSSNQPSQSPRSTRSKLSAVGKLKMASPKVRRLSAPSTKNLSFSPKALRQSANRSASLSPDSKTPSPEQTSYFHSSSPPQSSYFLSRSQSSPHSSVMTPIQGVISGRISDFLLSKGRETSPASAGLDRGTVRSPLVEDRLSGHPSSTSHHPLPSPYSRVTAPRMPSHTSGHASDATSVLSGELPPAMGKTSLLCPNRNSVVSSGYESMVRDSEATGSSTSNRGSVSDKSCSQISVARSIRTGRRRGNTGAHQRRLSHSAPLSMRRSASGPRAHWVDRGIPEGYEIKVYEIDDVEKMQRRGAAGKQGPACFSAKLKFLEHRQQRISEIRAKYNGLKRELEQAKQNLMLEPARWNQEFDLWQTFEVDSLEHLEALEVVTARLESKVNLCKANVMMVTSFDVSTKRRLKRRRRAASVHQQGFMGI